MLTAIVVGGGLVGAACLLWQRGVIMRQDADIAGLARRLAIEEDARRRADMLAVQLRADLAAVSPGYYPTTVPVTQ